MGASPFGMAYGIGAGLSGVSQAYYKAQDDATNLAMKNLQLQNMQQAQQDDSSARDIMSQPFTPRPDTVVDAANPVYAQQAAADTAQTAANQASVDDLGDEGQGQQAPEYSTTPTAPQEIQKTIQAYTTPQQKLADEYRQKAQMLRSKGLWRSSMELDKVADQNEQEHEKLARKGLANAIKFNQNDKILNYIHGLGGVNAVDAKSDGDGGLTITSKDANGSEQDVYLDKDDVIAIETGKDLADVWKTGLANTAKKQQREDRKTANQSSLEEKTNYHKALIENGKDRNQTARMNAQNRIEYQKTNAGGVVVQRVMARSRNYIALAAQDGVVLDPVTAEAQAWKQEDTSKTAKDPALSVARERLKQLEAGNYNRPLKPNNPNYSEWKQVHDITMGALTPTAPSKTAYPAPRTSVVPSPTVPQQPSQLPAPDTRPDGFKAFRKDPATGLKTIPVHWTAATKTWDDDAK